MASLTQSLVPAPLRVILTGQLIQRFQGNKCRVSVNYTAPDHKLVVSAVLFRGDVPTDLFSPMVFEPGQKLPQNLVLEVQAPKFPGVAPHRPGGHLNKNGPLPSQENHLSWAIDPESSEFPKFPTEFDESLISPGMILDNGLYHSFRTHDMRILRRGGGLGDEDLVSIATHVAANIRLDGEKNKAILRWEDGTPIHEFEAPHDPSVRFEIKVENNPSSHGGHGPGPVDTDFHLFYEVMLPKIPDPDRFHVTAERLDTFAATARPTPLVSPDVPCMPIFPGGG